MTDTTTSEAAQAGSPIEATEDGWEWAIVEVFGHRRHVGRIREEERFGAKLLRIDIPVKGDPAAFGWETICYAGASIFSFSPCTEALALKANRPYEPRYALIASDERDDTENSLEDDPEDDPEVIP